MDSANSGENRLGSIVDYTSGSQIVRMPNEESKFESDTMLNLHDFSDEVEDEIEFMRVDQMGEESQFVDSDDSDDDELEMFGSKMIAFNKGN